MEYEKNFRINQNLLICQLETKQRGVIFKNLNLYLYVFEWLCDNGGVAHILYWEGRLIHNCKPLWVPSGTGISEWTIPLPAVIHCKSPASIIPLCPSKSSCITAPCPPHKKIHFLFNFIGTNLLLQLINISSDLQQIKSLCCFLEVAQSHLLE